MPKEGFQFSVTGWVSRVTTNQFVEKLNCSKTDSLVVCLLSHITICLELEIPFWLTVPNCSVLGTSYLLLIQVHFPY